MDRNFDINEPTSVIPKYLVQPRTFLNPVSQAHAIQIHIFTLNESASLSLAGKGKTQHPVYYVR